MAGIYLHIPFCKQACYYCDFHFSTSLNTKNDFLQALVKEISLQKNYLAKDEEIESVYFGGGTPSLLTSAEVMQIMDALHQQFTIVDKAEITLEANPDDLSQQMIQELAKTPINRFSVGIQSFNDKDLKWMNRAHTAQQANQSIALLKQAGYTNITIDLIYGTPTLSNEEWKNNLNKAFVLDVQHISAYSLTVEDKTALAHMVQKGSKENVDENKTAQQFEILLQAMKDNNFIQYEISNFCKEGYYSKHNSSYWLKSHYLGLGPSAHSYNGHSRQWNVANNVKYIKALNNTSLDYEKEELTAEQRFNEYILTALRTIWGIDLNYVSATFNKHFASHLEQAMQTYLLSEHLYVHENKILLSDKGKLIADSISSDLFVLENN